MGSLAIESDDKIISDIYLDLGLKQSGKGAPKIPRALSLLSSILEKLVRRNDAQFESTQALTIFHGLRAPTLSVRQYVDRLFKYSGCSPSCFVVANVYVDRFLRRTEAHLTSLNVHRLLITSVMLAAKFMDDAFFSNAYYAKVGGVTTGELNRLEMRFLFSIDFRLQVNLDTFRTYCGHLETESAEALRQIERPMRACKINDGHSWPGKDDSALKISAISSDSPIS